MDYLDILLNGSVDEKNELTYYLIDTQKKGYFNIEDLKSLVLSIVNIWLVFSGNQISNYLLFSFFINKIIDENLSNNIEIYVQKLFGTMDADKKGQITFPEFNSLLKKDPKLLEIIDALNEGFTQNIKQENHIFPGEIPPEKIEQTIKKIEKSIQNFEKYLNNLEIISGYQKEQKPNDQGVSFSNSRIRGPEPGSYPKSVKFDQEEDKFGLEEDRENNLTKISDSNLDQEKKMENIC